MISNSKINVLSISSEIALRWIPQDLTDGESILVQVINDLSAWANIEAESHYLSQYWYRKPLPEPISIQKAITWADIDTESDYLSQYR